MRESFGDRQMITLLKRCDKLTQLSFNDTRISNKSVGQMIEILSPEEYILVVGVRDNSVRTNNIKITTHFQAICFFVL